jgi:hypothetical protein
MGCTLEAIRQHAAELFILELKVKVKQCRYRLGVAQRVPGS